MTKLRILAGPSAYKQIQSKGLSPEDISAIFGASGAAKWLTIYGLDKAIFSKWLKPGDHLIDLYGTSVGAFKLAAAAQADPAHALSCLANAYIDQHYRGKVDAQQVATETGRILSAFLTGWLFKKYLLPLICISANCNRFPTCINTLFSLA